MVNELSQGKNTLIKSMMQFYFMANQKVSFIEEWCMLITRECWEDVGPFSPELPQVGHSFIMTLKAQTKGYAPQIMNNPICHHYRIFALDINEYEKIIEKAMVDIPKLLSYVQTTSLSNPKL